MLWQSLKDLEHKYDVHINSQKIPPGSVTWRVTITPRAGGPAIVAEQPNLKEVVQDAVDQAEAKGWYLK